jgi:hypothetical protein
MSWMIEEKITAEIPRSSRFPVSGYVSTALWPVYIGRCVQMVMMQSLLRKAGGNPCHLEIMPGESRNLPEMANANTYNISFEIFKKRWKYLKKKLSESSIATVQGKESGSF